MTDSGKPGGERMPVEGRGGLVVLYEDPWILAVDKQPRQVVHAGAIRTGNTLVARVRRYLGRTVAHPVHRLDGQTSGVVLFAKGSAAARALCAAFARRGVEKTYLALVRGTAPIHADVRREIPAKARRGPRVPARTLVARLGAACVEPFPVSVVACRPLTGRLHQVRRHMAHLRHPILMDATYGNSRQNRAFSAAWGITRLALHAYAVRVPEGVVPGGVRTVVAPVPADLRALWARLGIGDADVTGGLRQFDRWAARSAAPANRGLEAPPDP